MANSGFISHARLAFTERPEQFVPDGQYDRNTLEKIGGGLLWHVTDLPQHAWHALNNPKVLTVAFTALALLAVQFAFYPTASILAVKSILTLIAPYITAAGVKLTAYVLIQTAILGWGVRSMGRFTNEALMNGFYGRVNA